MKCIKNVNTLTTKYNTLTTIYLTEKLNALEKWNSATEKLSKIRKNTTFICMSKNKI